MVLKRKKDCKLIYDNNNYYIDGAGYFFKFNNLDDAQYFYNNFKKLYLNSRQLYEIEGKVVLDLYPSDVELILKGIEQLKFFIDKSMYFKCDQEFLNSKSLDCFYLNQYIYSIYKNCVPKDKQNL